MRRFVKKCAAIVMAGVMMALLVMPMFEVTTMADIRGEAVGGRVQVRINDMSDFRNYPDIARHRNIYCMETVAEAREYLASTGLLSTNQIYHATGFEGFTWLTLPAPVTIEIVCEWVGWDFMTSTPGQWDGVEVDEALFFDRQVGGWGSRITAPVMGADMEDDFFLSTLVITQPGVYTLQLIDGGRSHFVIEVTGDQPTQPTPTPAPSPTPPTSTQAPNLTTASSWAHNGITQAYTNNLIPTNLQTNFRANATRAEFSALAVALYETVTGREIAGRRQFNDTNDINVQKMGYLGIVTGVGGGNFAPNNGITREQAAVMIVRLAYAIGQPLPSSAPTFADNNRLSSWAVDAVGQVQAAGIMSGVGNNQFAPRGDYTREQSIITMLRLFEMLD